MESLDPDFEYPHHREVLNQIKPHLVQFLLEENTYLLFYHYKLLRQKMVQKRLSASQIMSELIQNYEKTLGINN